MRPNDGLTTELDLRDNPPAMGEAIDQESAALDVPSFERFRQLRNEIHHKPTPPGRAVALSDNPQKALVFAQVNHAASLHYLTQKKAYERKKSHQELLRLYADDLAGYGAYVLAHHQTDIAGFSLRRPYVIGEASRKLHTYITGGSGSGKSECAKAIIWHYLTENTKPALVLIDPHGDISKQVAQFAPNAENGRLIYVEPRIDGVHFPGLNPFDIPGKEHLSEIDAEAIAKEFIHAFREILGGDLTTQMETLLQNTLPVLVRMPGATIYDLIDFLQPRLKGKDFEGVEYKAERYIDFARKHCQNAQLLRFLVAQFDADGSYIQTRNAITTRLLFVFGPSIMQAVFSGPRTVRLEEAIPQRRLVVFNLSNLGEDATTIGRFVLISLKIFALNQARIPEHLRHPCHTFVDECQRFVSNSVKDILQEARKFALYLTLAQQDIGAGMSPDLYDAIKTNVGVRVSGANSADNRAITSRETGVPVETLEALPIGKFSVWERARIGRGGGPVTVSFGTRTIGNRAAMPPDRWDALLSEQIATYYRKPSKDRLTAAQPMETKAKPPSPDISKYLNA